MTILCASTDDRFGSRAGRSQITLAIGERLSDSCALPAFVSRKSRCEGVAPGRRITGADESRCGEQHACPSFPFHVVSSEVER